jgi:PAS domain S-box-containing protein
MNIPMDCCGSAHRCSIAPREDSCRRFGSRLPFKNSRWLAILGIPLLCFFFDASAVGQSGKNVLFLFSAIKYSDETLSVIEPAIRARYPQQITFYHAYLDDPQVEEKSYRQSLAETLRRRYAGVKMDVVIACNPAALNFATEFRSSVFPDVPIVFVGVGELELAAQKSWPGVTGVVTASGFRPTIDLALYLQPDTQVVAVVAGATRWDSSQLAALHSELLRYQDRVKEIDIVGTPNYQLLQRVAALPPRTVVMFQVYPQFSDEPDFGTWDLLTETARRLPTYSAFPRLCIDGCIGGAYVDNLELLTSTANLVAHVLSGVRPEDTPMVHNPGFQVQVDARALQRWQISEAAVPPGALLMNREPTVWERGRKYFVAGFAVMMAQTLLILGLFWQRRRRRKAELELGKSEEKFSRVFRESPLAITIVKISDGRYVEVNGTFELSTGWRRDEVIGRTPLEIDLWVNPDQRTAFMQELHEKGNIRNLEVTFRRKDGQIRTSLGSAELIEVNGESCALSVIADITDRKLAEEAISTFSRRLIEAQETERTRIARELHDDINQRLAMVAVSLKALKQDLPHSEQKTSRRIDETCAQVSELEFDIQALSHRLHPSKLEYLGLEAAAASLCRELSERQNVKIDFRCDGLPEDLSDDVSLCFFRVLQEALHNAVKYSGVDEFEVSLEFVSDEIQLRVHDSGTGFDPTLITPEHGLGLTSMNERLKLVSGELSIHSRPQEGTTILARVPIAQGTTTASAAA